MFVPCLNFYLQENIEAGYCDLVLFVVIPDVFTFISLVIVTSLPFLADSLTVVAMSFKWLDLL